MKISKSNVAWTIDYSKWQSMEDIMKVQAVTDIGKAIVKLAIEHKCA